MKWLIAVALFGVFILIVDAVVLGLSFGLWLGNKFGKRVEDLPGVAAIVMLVAFIALEWLVLTRL